MCVNFSFYFFGYRIGISEQISCSDIFQGEEIGMTDQWLSWNDTVDPAACNSNPSIYEQFSRDPERTPFQWNGEKNAGFSTADKTWLPVAENYREVNVEQEKSAEKSHLKVYKSLKDIRKEPALRNGNTKYAALGQQVVAIARLNIFRSKW